MARGLMGFMISPLSVPQTPKLIFYSLAPAHPEGRPITKKSIEGLNFRRPLKMPAERPDADGFRGSELL